MTTYWTADPHYNRKGTNLVGRPFSTPLEMSMEVLENINSRVNRNDRLIIAGDFSFNEPAYWRTKHKCRDMTLVRGNHDPWPKCKLAFGERNCRDTYDTKCKGQPAFVSHYPHCYWPKSHYGSFMLYGHCHDQRTETIETQFPGIRSMDIGVDAAKRLLGKYTCFSEDEIYDILIARQGHDLITFYEHRRGIYQKDHNETRTETTSDPEDTSDEFAENSY